MLCNGPIIQVLSNPMSILSRCEICSQETIKNTIKKDRKEITTERDLFQFLTIVIFLVSYLVLTCDLLYFFLIPIAEVIICIPVINSVIEILRANVLSP